MNNFNDPERQREKALVERISRRDEAAFSELYDRLAQGLYALAMQIISDAREAEDILQETFHQIWNRAESYQPERSQVFTWAVMILRHRAIDRLRVNRRLDRTLEKAIEFDQFNYVDLTSADLPVMNERQAEVRSALARLPEEARKAIALSFFSGLTHEEIAAHLAEPIGTIKARIRRGLLQLRNYLKEAA